MRFGSHDTQEFPAAHHGQHLVEQMNSPVEDHAAAVFLFLPPAGWNAPRALNARFNPEDPSELIFIDEFFHGQIIFIPASVLVNGKQLSRSVSRRRHLIKRRHRHFDRLFTYDVFARLKRLYDKLLMVVVRNSYNDRFHGAVRQFLKRGKTVWQK